MRREANAEHLSSLLDGIEPRSVRRFTSAATTFDLPRRSVVYRSGEAAAGLYVVCAGSVKLSLPFAQSEEHVVALIEPGSWFGESAMILGGAYENDASTLERTRLAYIPAAMFLASLREDRSLATKILAELSRRLHAAMVDTAGTLNSARERVMCWLDDEVARASSAVGNIEIVLPGTKRVLASRLHMTPAHLSRLLKDLKEARLIDLRGRRIVVHSATRLRGVLRKS